MKLLVMIVGVVGKPFCWKLNALICATGDELTHFWVKTCTAKKPALLSYWIVCSVHGVENVPPFQDSPISASSVGIVSFGVTSTETAPPRDSIFVDRCSVTSRWSNRRIVDIPQLRVEIHCLADPRDTRHRN